MKKLFRRIPVFVVLLISLFCLDGCTTENSENKISVISTIFPGYDFARAIKGNNDNIEIKMLINPGAETHNYEPSPQDIINIENSDIFIYVGGESDEWVDEILKDIDTSKTKVVKLMDYVDVYEEEVAEGMYRSDDYVEEETDDDDEVEYDEHVWTSPKNAMQIVKKLSEVFINIDEKNKTTYAKNANNYIDELIDINTEIRAIIENAQRKEVVFGDRFPLLYFVKEYGLTYYAAFPGCSSETEASAKTLSFLINKVKTDKIPVVFKIELSNGNIADTIAEETGAEVLEFHTAHNISKEDFDNGVTYVDIMKRNIKNLKVALN